MKKLKQSVIAVAVLLSPLMVAPAALADTCENGFTGPDSNNLCTNTTTYTCTVSNENNIAIVNDNTQVSLSGDSSTGGNTSGGSSQTGSATNSNGVTFNVVVTNETEESPAVCVATATVPATPTPAPVTPVAATGQGAATPVAAPKAAAPQTLAKTSGDETAGYLVGSVVALAAAFGLSRIAVLAYGRYKA